MGQYGNLTKVDTTGASWETARADGLGCCGEAASHQLASSDLPHVNKYRGRIIRVARRHNVEPAVVAGIISRETRGGRGAGLSNGWGDHGNAWGLMQVDKRWFPSPRGRWDSEEHIDQGVEILISSYSQIHNKFPRWTKEWKLKGALAAYNMGAGNVKSYEEVDAKTTGRDYSNDVIARAQFFKGRGY